MKNIFILVAICCFLTSCNSSSGKKKDYDTGLSMSYNGFTIGKTALVNSKDETLKTNEVTMGEKVAIVVTDISNYQLKDGRAYPGLDLIVKDKNDLTVLEGRDILSSADGYSLADAAVVRGTITIGAPMSPGNTYHAVMKIWDKQKEDSQVNLEIDLEVK